MCPSIDLKNITAIKTITESQNQNPKGVVVLKKLEIAKMLCLSVFGEEFVKFINIIVVIVENVKIFNS